MSRTAVIFYVFFLSSSLMPATGASQNSHRRLDPAMELPVVNTSALTRYDYSRLDYGMNRGMAQTPGGRIWACWVAGGDNEDAFLLLNYSDDWGANWSAPVVVIDPDESGLNEKRRTRVGNVWTDPSGRLWFFFDQVMTTYDGRSGLWYTVCENPDSAQPRWTKPIRIWHGCALNKPIVLSNGKWLLPVSLWDRSKIKDSLYKNAYHDLDSFRMAHVFLSSDKGVTWHRKGGIAFPNPRFDEHHVIERKDGSLWMTARTRDGIFQSFSYDGGATWSRPEKYLPHVDSRHFICRLSSGNLLLVRHGWPGETTKLRSKLMAFLSEDDGETWKGGLMLDERRGVSYPDGFQAPDGLIYISYDRNRDTDGHIMMTKFTEDDVLLGSYSVLGSEKRKIIIQPLGLDKVEM